jgi:hypothetical protein
MYSTRICRKKGSRKNKKMRTVEDNGRHQNMYEMEQMQAKLSREFKLRDLNEHNVLLGFFCNNSISIQIIWKIKII